MCHCLRIRIISENRTWRRKSGAMQLFTVSKRKKQDATHRRTFLHSRFHFITRHPVLSFLILLYHIPFHLIPFNSNTPIPIPSISISFGHLIPSHPFPFHSSASSPIPFHSIPTPLTYSHGTLFHSSTFHPFLFQHTPYNPNSFQSIPSNPITTLSIPCNPILFQCNT